MSFKIRQNSEHLPSRPNFEFKSPLCICIVRGCTNFEMFVNATVSLNEVSSALVYIITINQPSYVCASKTV